MEPLPLRPVVEIAASNESTRALAKRFGVSELTIAKWRKRASVNDLPHTPHRLQTTLSPAQEAIVVELRKSLLLPLDDLVAVTKEFICPKASRSGLDRSLRRHGLSNLHKLKPIQPKFASRARVPTGEHAFDQLCAELGVEHRLTKPRTPQTNGMVERFNGRISDVLQSHHFVSGEDLAQTLDMQQILHDEGCCT